MLDQETPESVLRPTQAIKEVSTEKEANAYLRTGWRLIRTFHTTNEKGSQQVGYVFAWQHDTKKPRKPHIPKKRVPED